MTFSIHCPCCGQVVEARDAGFTATTVTVVACDRQRTAGVHSWECRKSVAYEAIVPEPVLRHRDGFVTFG